MTSVTLVAQLTGRRSLYQYWGKASNMYLLVDAAANASYLVDCGMPADAPGLIRALATFPPLKQVVCTHFHVDHIAGWPALKTRFQNCGIRFHENAEPYVTGRARVPMPGIKDIENVLLPVMKEYRYFPKTAELFHGALLGTPFKRGFPKDRVTYFNCNSEMLPGFLTIATPGHRPEEVSFYEPNHGLFISGDFIIVIQNKVTVNSFVADKKAQLKSLQAIRRFSGIRTICPGHGHCRKFSWHDI